MTNILELQNLSAGGGQERASSLSLSVCGDKSSGVSIVFCNP
ncbi:SapB/AmfS family lanthipeptide [Cellulomonas triticagri]|nr:SapB/AmfS family lanthipeptide [Cellulomonas triticagri]